MNTQRVKEIMKEKGITQVDLAKATGTSQAFISYCLDGLKVPSLGVFKVMVKTLGCSADEIL